MEKDVNTPSGACIMLSQDDENLKIPRVAWHLPSVWKSRGPMGSIKLTKSVKALFWSERKCTPKKGYILCSFGKCCNSPTCLGFVVFLCLYWWSHYFPPSFVFYSYFFFQDRHQIFRQCLFTLNCVASIWCGVKTVQKCRVTNQLISLSNIKSTSTSWFYT